ncbi:fimbrial protein [Stenotrophomonas mori]|uniref:Fimbrial protein n=1 Tax=Stenotrophomonas mori TaxID=2871096 RepID=A0ABT0SJP8_9GAMM|nr:fimbrial protein [Stenotrophomonas mori]MCL7715563.1 fimbrial protein [Stenotrophomonas mori]
MKKLFIGLAALSAFAAGTSQAAVGAQGNINFTGSINNDSCVVSGSGATNVGKNLLVDMGTVSANTLGTEANPAVNGGGMSAFEKTIDLKVECLSGTKVALKLTPQTRSGKGIAVTGGASNVQIMLVNDNQVLDFTTGSASLEAPFNGGNVVIPMKAYYTLVQGKDVADVVAGQANATVAYELSYD